MNSKGFTLIEALITAAVFTLLLAIGSYSLTELKYKNEYQLIHDELVAVVQYAKIQALKIGHPVYLIPLSPTETNWAKGMSLNHINPDTNQVELLYEWKWHHPNWQLHWAGLNDSNKIVLAAEPNHMMSNGHFQLLDRTQQQSMSLVLNRLGRLKIDYANSAAHTVTTPATL